MFVPFSFAGHAQICLQSHFVASQKARCRKKRFSLMPMNIIEITDFFHVGAL